MRVVISAIVVAAFLAPAILAAARQAAAQDEPRLCGEPALGRGMDGDEQAMLDLLNSYRAAHDLMPLAPAPSLIASAQAKAWVVSQQAEFIHDDPTRTWEQRFADCGYPVDAAFGEVLGCETDGRDALMRTWQESPIHEAVLGNSLFNAAGIARFLHPDGYSCWVIDLGSVVV